MSDSRGLRLTLPSANRRCGFPSPAFLKTLVSDMRSSRSGGTPQMHQSELLEAPIPRHSRRLLLPRQSGFTIVGRLATSVFLSVAESGLLALRLACSPFQFASPITGDRAGSATC